MSIQSSLFVKPLVKPDNLSVIRVQGDDKELSRRLLIEPVCVSMEGIEHDGASTWMRLQTHDETVSVRKQPHVWLLWRCVSHEDILTLSRSRSA